MKINLKKKREPTEKAQKEVIRMVNTWGEHYYSWDGKLYNSDIVRSCIRPKVKAIGKLVGKHIRESDKELMVNPDANIRFLLSEPNPYMTGQQFQEKLANQLVLNNNAFALIIRDENGKPQQLYPIPCEICETKWINNELWLKFIYKNGNTQQFPYREIIHLRQDYNENDIFGTSPAPALKDMMEVIGTIDQGMIKAIKNSGIIRWLLTFTNSMRDEDIKSNVKKFVDNYMSIDNDTFGAAGVDAKANITRIEPKDYVPNALQSKEVINRIYSFFNTNEKIIQSKWEENEWIAYYEAEIEPVVIQLGEVYSVRLFNRHERAYGDKIIFEANNLQCASISTKLSFVQMVDRGAMTPNQWCALFNMAPLPGGDKPIRRLDTQVVDLVENILDKMNNENYIVMAGIISQLLNVAERRRNEIQDRYTGNFNTE